MKLDLNKIEFNQNELNTLHDIIWNAIDKDDLTNEEIIEYWKKLPEYIKLDTLTYGVCDTPTRDNMYVWFQNNCT